MHTETPSDERRKDLAALTEKFKHFVRYGGHFCNACQRITELESDDAHGQCCIHCGSHRVSFHPKVETAYDLPPTHP